MKLELKRSEIPPHLLKYFHPVGFKPKDEIDIPNMVCEALRRDGWYRRQTIIWHKPNPMPESVTDRPTKAHEYIFLLCKSERYFYDADAIKEPTSINTHWTYPQPDKAAIAGITTNGTGKSTLRSARDSFKRNGSKREQPIPNQAAGTHRPDRDESEWDTATRNKRSVWTVATKPYAGAHFATFPPELIEPCILAGTSAHGCCMACGAPWERVTERVGAVTNERFAGEKYAAVQQGGISSTTLGSIQGQTITRGWQPTCTCNAAIMPCTVLDPFYGSGTVGAIALKHARNFIGIDLDAKNLELAHDRIRQTQPPLLQVNP